MKIFLTGANGFIGSRLVRELIGAGHEVVGLTRSDAGAQHLAAAGAEAHRGDLEDLNSLRVGAESCDGVIHTAFDHNFSNYLANCQKDQRAIETMGAALEGSDRPFVITSTTLFGEPIAGQLADEDTFNTGHSNPRVTSEITAEALMERGANVSLVRLSQIHDTQRQGLVTFMIDLARRTGRSSYIEGSSNRWSAAHVSDAVRVFRLALERQHPGARYHATDEEGVSIRSIAEAIGHRLGLPVVALSAQEAATHFGWLNGFISKDMTASSEKTKMRLNWQPMGPRLLTDIANLDFQSTVFSP
ncbi:SDR family oxidoreductase [Gluconobacter albidus]|uniref:NAD-dependent dehydratase n=1 Tax=Gluconobacter albidus TaxID=318683 RepID=A0AAW3R092_9PROT|nr:SDR family oxidoreductase [Gluconobacter albidus]KXV42143.1 NAD-dependent dehydratase [Gluconobacter albidus]GBQ88139.1 nucleoside-diphosphate-sugar epimerase [Gluconobacter albidus NBRC 3250]GLQ69406.1 NAD-dependent dehydratase [Gluconobacter albidus]